MFASSCVYMVEVITLNMTFGKHSFLTQIIFFMVLPRPSYDFFKYVGENK